MNKIALLGKSNLTDFKWERKVTKNILTTK